MPESDHKGEWTLPICTRCGGIVSYKLDGGCTCEPTHAKTGRSITVIPRSQLDAVAEGMEIVRRIGEHPTLTDAEKLEQIERTVRPPAQPEEETA